MSFDDNTLTTLPDHAHAAQCSPPELHTDRPPHQNRDQTPEDLLTQHPILWRYHRDHLIAKVPDWERARLPQAYEDAMAMRDLGATVFLYLFDYERSNGRKKILIMTTI